MRDAGLGRTFYSFTINAAHDEMQKSGVGFYYLRLCLEVNDLLKIQDIDDVSWPSLEDMTTKTLETLEMLAIASRGPEHSSSMSVAFTLVEPSEEATNISFVNGQLDKAVMMSQVILRGETPWLEVFIELTAPSIELLRDGKVVQYSSLGQAFAESDEPINIKLCSSKGSGKFRLL